MPSLVISWKTILHITNYNPCLAIDSPNPEEHCLCLGELWEVFTSHIRCVCCTPLAYGTQNPKSQPIPPPPPQPLVYCKTRTWLAVRQPPPQTYLLPRLWHEQSFSATMSSSKLACFYLQREAPSHALPRSRAGSHLLLQLRYLTGITDRQAETQFYPCYEVTSPSKHRQQASGVSASLGHECNHSPGHPETALPHTCTGSSSPCLALTSNSSLKKLKTMNTLTVIL